MIDAGLLHIMIAFAAPARSPALSLRMAVEFAKPGPTLKAIDTSASNSLSDTGTLSAAAIARSKRPRSRAKISSASARVIVIPMRGIGAPAAAVCPVAIVTTPTLSRYAVSRTPSRDCRASRPISLVFMCVSLYCLDMTEEREQWVPAPGYEGFAEVSDQGRVRTLDSVRQGERRGLLNLQFKAGRVLRPHLSRAGYEVVAPKIGAARKKVFVHRLVALAFVKGYADGLSVNHINGCKVDNRAENLEWATLAENTAHQWRLGLANLRGENQPGHKLTTKQVVAIKRLLAAGASRTDLAIVAEVSYATIKYIGDGKRWQHLLDAA
jgi:hypothetical protein